ncbi:hypothetical protein [Sutcliffiella rhizosphaerae]|uniref:Uncharacterized protein n=1 Tax=Sutcliffiella rhizosphaerae TaxID=2880967 RepID=A0ABM8YR68_9BACI|nr:hypothetical protein [Sutcliffiella rhizosphaerae]CAG9622472.1 hypothetical protein BACCIP111883_03263 [Sutcliffiella rhizosphaerae]
MIWLFVLVPISILIVFSIIIDKKNNWKNSPPDVNKGNQNVEAETSRYLHYNSSDGDGGGNH